MALFKNFVSLDDFKLGDVIGNGNYGIVYKAVSIKKGKPFECAVKILTRAIEIKKFMREVQVQAKLNHMAVLPLLGFSFPFQGNDKYAVITSIMPNGSLKNLIKQAALGAASDNWPTIKAICIFGIAAGMAYVHQENIIHRDLKTENIMLDENYYPKIADFGVSKIFVEGSNIEQTTGVGTLAYMAPEIFDDDHYTNKIDVFSFAIILYELATTKKPWQGRKNLNEYTLPILIKSGERPTIDTNEVSDDYKELIDRCWDKEPDHRPSFIEIVNGFIEHKDVYFDDAMIDSEALEDYMELAIKGLDGINSKP